MCLGRGVVKVRWVFVIGCLRFSDWVCRCSFFDSLLLSIVF